MSQAMILGIDIGGTNTAFGIVDPAGELVYKDSISTVEAKHPEALLKQVHQKVSEAGYQPRAIGIGAPNGNSKTGQIEFAPNLQWKGIVAIESIATELWECPCYLVNDANAAALGELEYGCARGLEHFVCITLGTGLGSGIVIDRQLIIGSNGLAGEFGHISLDANGRKCGCGRFGCLETYASATGVMNTLTDWRLNQPEIVKGLEHITTAQALFEAAQHDHAGAMAIVDYTAEKLGFALANYACFSDPEAYVLFGGLAQSGTFFLEKVEHHLNQNSLEIYKNTKVLLSSLPASDAAILGAAAATKQNRK